MFLPSPLLPGDTIGIIAPAGQLKEHACFHEGVKVLKELGYEIKFPRDLWPGHGFLSDTDKKRADEFHKMWADTEIKALMCLRGGYGSLRLLPFLDIEEIRKKPKLLIGFSDITILQNYLFAKALLPSIQGPVITSLQNSPSTTLQLFQQALALQPDYIFREKNIELIHGTNGAEGFLIGGNLTSLVSLLGTPYDVSYDDSILFLEDVSEPTYKVDRMLTQLYMAGKFNKLKGILLGDFSSEQGETRTDKLRHTEAIWKRIVELIEKKNIPILTNISSGHIDQNNPFILGSKVIIEAGTNRITTLLAE